MTKAETFVNICGVPTKIVTWGKGLTEVGKHESEDLVLMIPGNPGYTPLYDEFLEETYNSLGCPVWIIGHAGHDSQQETVPDYRGNESLYNLHGQVVHKETFIETYVPKNIRLHLVGHSIGGYMIVQLLKIPNIQSRIIGSYLLFPTIERIADSIHGRLFLIVSKLQWLGLLFLQLFIFLPIALQEALMHISWWMFSIPKNYRNACRGLVHPKLMEKVTRLGLNEMIVVKERDNETLKANIHKIKLYYATTDNWIPRSCFMQLKNDIPGIDAEMCNYQHAFVLRQSKQVAHLVAEWIRKKLK